MQKKTDKEWLAEVQELRTQLEEAQETLNAIRRGEVDGLVVSTPKGEQVYTITGAEKPYRALIEDMREGAVMLSDDDTVLYCNSGFARMMKHSIEKIVGLNIKSMVCPTHLLALRKLLTLARAQKGAVTKEITLQANGNILVPTLMSINSLQSDTLNNTFLVVTDLTEHMEEEVKRYTNELELAQIALSESEQRWETTLSSIGDAVIATDMLGKIKFMNGVAEKLTGWTLVEAAGRPIKEVFNIINEFTRKIVDDPVTKVLEKGTIVGLANHTLLVRKDRTEIAIDDSGAPIRRKDGKTTGVVLIFRDITERKKAEEALSASEERYRHLVQFAPTGIYEVDFTGPRFISVNDAMCEMSGYPRDELLDKNPFDLLAPESQILFKQRIGKALAGEKIPENVEYKVITKAGQELWATLNIKLVSQNGRFCGAQVVAHDLTERKKAEEAIRQNEQTFLKLIESSPFGIYVVNSQFRIEHMNKGSQNGAFRNVRPVIGRDFSEAMHILWPETIASEILSHFRQTLETGKPYYSPPFVKPRHDVKIVEAYEWELQRTKLPNGEFGVICYYYDSTKLRETERKLNEAQAQLKEHTKNLERLVEERTKQLKDSERLAAIGATAGMVGHDIRNPLQSIISDVFLAKTELASIPDSEEKKNALESMVEIEKNIDYINKIVQDLQDYARPLNPKIEESDLKSIVEAFITKNGLPKNIKVDIKITDKARRIRADSYYLTRILFNLVTNAVQAMPRGGKLTIGAYKEANDTILTVKDTGVGIPQEIRDKMFTLMFTTKSKGQGFGLPVVKRMTESLGGTVTFESTERKGTTFTIRLPPQRA